MVLTGPWLLYGANGYTGELVARLAAARGHRPVLAGRRADAVCALADALRLERRLFALDDPARIDAALAGMAAVLFVFADRGFTPELQVDAALREIRLCARTLRGATRVQNRIPMREIEEVFARPDPEEPGQTELCFRVDGVAEPIRIAAGSAGDLAPVLERLTRDLRTPRERVELRLAS